MYNKIKSAVFNLAIGIVVGVVFWGVIVLAFALTVGKKTVCSETRKEEIKEEVVLTVPSEDDFKEVVGEIMIEDNPETVYIGKFKLTAYCSCKKCCGKWANNRPKDENGNSIVIGSSGERLVQGVSVAVDPSVIEYGSKVIIDGHEYIAHDCGGAIKGNRIDVYFDDHQEALNFGVKYCDVEVSK